nr:hypothetical protein [uncultured Flavobacterium sp.]
MEFKGTKEDFINGFEFSNNEDSFYLSENRGYYLIFKNGCLIHRYLKFSIAIKKANQLIKQATVIE